MANLWDASSADRTAAATNTGTAEGSGWDEYRDIDAAYQEYIPLGHSCVDPFFYDRLYSEDPALYGGSGGERDQVGASTASEALFAIDEEEEAPACQDETVVPEPNEESTRQAPVKGRLDPHRRGDNYYWAREAKLSQQQPHFACEHCGLSYTRAQTLQEHHEKKHAGHRYDRFNCLINNPHLTPLREPLPDLPEAILDTTKKGHTFPLVLRRFDEYFARTPGVDWDRILPPQLPPRVHLSHNAASAFFLQD